MNLSKMDQYQAWIQKAEDEGAMAKVQLDRVSDLADMMHDALDEEDQLPGWIQNKISDSLHNLEASFTHIAYDKKQDMELSKSKETFTNILQKDNHTPQRASILDPAKTAYRTADAATGGQLDNPVPQSFAALAGAINEINKNPNLPQSVSDAKAGIKSFVSGKPANPLKNPLKLGGQAFNKLNQILEPIYGKDSLNFKKPVQMVKPFTVGTPGSLLRGSVKGGAAKKPGIEELVSSKTKTSSTKGKATTTTDKKVDMKGAKVTTTKTKPSKTKSVTVTQDADGKLSGTKTKVKKSGKTKTKKISTRRAARIARREGLID